MNEQQYRAALKAHDWYYPYADNYGAFVKGKESADRLEMMRKQLDPDYAIWNELAPADFRRTKAAA